MTRSTHLWLGLGAAVVLAVGLGACGSSNDGLKTSSDGGRSDGPAAGGSGGSAGAGGSGAGGATSTGGSGGSAGAGGSGAGGATSTGGSGGGMATDGGGAGGSGGSGGSSAGGPDAGMQQPDADNNQCVAGNACRQDCTRSCRTTGTLSCVCNGGRLFCGVCEVPDAGSNTDSGSATCPRNPAGMPCGGGGTTPAQCTTPTGGTCICLNRNWVCSPAGIAACPAGTMPQAACTMEGSVCRLGTDAGAASYCFCSSRGGGTMSWRCPG